MAGSWPAVSERPISRHLTQSHTRDISLPATGEALVEPALDGFGRLDVIDRLERNSRETDGLGGRPYAQRGIWRLQLSPPCGRDRHRERERPSSFSTKATMAEAYVIEPVGIFFHYGTPGWTRPPAEVLFRCPIPVQAPYLIDIAEI